MCWNVSCTEQRGALRLDRPMLTTHAYAHTGYDYTVLVAMSPSISANFFPPGDVAAKQLSFWWVETGRLAAPASKPSPLWLAQ